MLRCVEAWGNPVVSIRTFLRWSSDCWSHTAIDVINSAILASQQWRADHVHSCHWCWEVAASDNSWRFWAVQVQPEGSLSSCELFTPNNQSRIDILYTFWIRTTSSSIQLLNSVNFTLCFCSLKASENVRMNAQKLKLDSEALDEQIPPPWNFCNSFNLRTAILLTFGRPMAH